MLAVFEFFSYFVAIIYCGLWVPEFFSSQEKQIEPWAFATKTVLSGLLTAYVGFLVFADFNKVYFMCHIIGGISALWMIYKTHKGLLTITILPLPPWKKGLVGFAGLCLLSLLLAGVTDWQARSVWFFQAKILFATKSLSSVDWQNTFYSFALFGHPKLYPFTIAFVNSGWSEWNQYLTKWPTILFALPIFTSLFSMNLRKETFLFLFLSLIGICGEMFWNGSPDAFAALYFTMGLLNLSLYQIEKNNSHLLQTILFIGLLPSLSPEGWPLVVCFTLAFSFVHKEAQELMSQKNTIKFISIPVLAFAIWYLRKVELNLDTSLLRGSGLFERLKERLTDTSALTSLFVNTFKTYRSLIAFMALSVGYFHIAQTRYSLMSEYRPLRKEFLWVLAAGGLFAIYLFFGYWATPFHLAWFSESYLLRSALCVKLAVVTYAALTLQDSKLNVKELESEITFSASKRE